MGLGLADGLGETVGEGRAVVGAAVVGATVGVAVVGVGGTACGVQAPTTTIAMDTPSAPMSRSRPANARSLTEIVRLVDIPDTLAANLYAERTSK
jgi:hypothetical protein